MALVSAALGGQSPMELLASLADDPASISEKTRGTYRKFYSFLSKPVIGDILWSELTGRLAGTEWSSIASSLLLNPEMVKLAGIKLVPASLETARPVMVGLLARGASLSNVYMGPDIHSKCPGCGYVHGGKISNGN